MYIKAEEDGTEASDADKKTFKRRSARPALRWADGLEDGDMHGDAVCQITPRAETAEGVCLGVVDRAFGDKSTWLRSSEQLRGILLNKVLLVLLLLLLLVLMLVLLLVLMLFLQRARRTPRCTLSRRRYSDTCSSRC